MAGQFEDENKCLENCDRLGPRAGLHPPMGMKCFRGAFQGALWLCAEHFRRRGLGTVCPSECTSCSCKAKKGGGGWKQGRKETAASCMKRFAKLPWLDLIAGCCKLRRTM